MFQNINLQDNDLENGYIYKILVEKIESLENEIKQIQEVINTAKDELNISLNDYVSIIKEIQKCASREELERHTEDTEIHLHKSKTLVNEESETYDYNHETE
jgi:uncharacterized protein (UPF0335 family)